MARTKLLKASGRFGVRYGQSVKRRVTTIEARQRKKQACPFCSGRAIRLSKGIWSCRKCGKKFAGHVYYLESEFKNNFQSKLNKNQKSESPKNAKPEALKKEKKTANKGESK